VNDDDDDDDDDDGGGGSSSNPSTNDVDKGFDCKTMVGGVESVLGEVRRPETDEEEEEEGGRRERVLTVEVRGDVVEGGGEVVEEVVEGVERGVGEAHRL